MTDKDNSSVTIVGPGKSARSLASPSVRYALLGAFGIIGALVIWRIVSPAHEVKQAKSKAETDLEKIMDTSKKAGATATSGGVAAGKMSDQPTGDPEAIARLNEVEAKKALDAKRKTEAEDRMLANLAYQEYIKRAQGLKYEPAMAAEWERRLKDAQAKGQPAPMPPEMTAENLEEIRKTQPELYNRWMAMHGQKGTAVASAVPGQKGQPGPAGAPTAGVAGVGAVPAGVDPKTGLPSDAVGHTGLPSDVAYALLDDGSPDIARGAIPVTVQYDIPGSKEKMTKTIWVRPGYLTNRSRPVDPTLLRDEDEAYRRSMKDSTDVPHEAAANVTIPYRYTNAKTRVAPGTDFSFQNRYVVVLPNPKGKLTPPNPPLPTNGGAQK